METSVSLSNLDKNDESGYTFGNILMHFSADYQGKWILFPILTLSRSLSPSLSLSISLSLFLSLSLSLSLFFPLSLCITRFQGLGFFTDS